MPTWIWEVRPEFKHIARAPKVRLDSSHYTLSKNDYINMYRHLFPNKPISSLLEMVQGTMVGKKSLGGRKPFI